MTHAMNVLGGTMCSYSYLAFVLGKLSERFVSKTSVAPVKSRAGEPPSPRGARGRCIRGRLVEGSIIYKPMMIGSKGGAAGSALAY